MQMNWTGQSYSLHLLKLSYKTKDNGVVNVHGDSTRTRSGKEI
jgi:hypothetical protein